MTTKQKLEKFLQEIDNVDYSIKDDFTTIIRGVSKTLDISNKEIATEFGASIRTVERWINGDSSPHPLYRHNVYDWMIKVITANLASVKPKRTVSSNPYRSTCVPMYAKGK